MSGPNVLFLFADQHNARCFSHAGHPEVATPNLDALASNGVRFAGAYCNNPICTPSRMSFLSGLYPSTHGYYGLYGPEPARRITSMFSHFRSAGYRTAALGKLHTPRYWIERDCQFVYDEFIEFPKYLEAVGLYEVNDNRAFTGNRDGETSALPYEHSCEMALVRQAKRFILNLGEPKDRGPRDAPWFAWVSFSRPHQPYTPSEPFASMYDAESLHLPPVSPEADGRGADRDEHRHPRMPEAVLRKQLAAYLGLVSQIDAAIGELITFLEEQGLLENTLIVYSSDHGDYAGEHGMMEKRGGISYSAITRIPLVVCPPGNGDAAGSVRDTIVESVDLFPTLCDLCGLATPRTVQGRSFCRTLLDPEARHRKSALTENAYRKALATPEYRYVANQHGAEPDELYDLRNDPWELENLIDSEQHRDFAHALQRELFDRVVRANRPVNSVNGGWHGHLYDEDGRIDLTAAATDNPYW